MSDIAFGIHAVDSLLRRAPQRFSLFIQTDRNDKRIQSLLTLAKNQGVSLPVSLSQIWTPRLLSAIRALSPSLSPHHQKLT